MNSQKTHVPDSRFARAINIFKKHGGILRTSQALKAGIHLATLYAMRDSGELEVISRGVFRLSDIPPLGNPNLVTVATRVSHGVICLISALSFYELTTQIPCNGWKNQKYSRFSASSSSKQGQGIFTPI
jgi:predicted transcriptional regulator of viral defense system